MAHHRLVACAVIGVAGLAAAGAGAVPAAAQGCKPKFAIGSSYDVQLCGMPDFDQHRQHGVLRGDGRSLGVGPALPANGNCHALPATMANLLGYYVAKGVRPGRVLQRFNWLSRPGYVARPNASDAFYLLPGQPYPLTEVAAYNATTTVIKHLGSGVSTYPGCGTSFESVLKYARWFRDVLPEVAFTATVKQVGVNTPREFANAMAAGATINATWGAYGTAGAQGVLATLGERIGGHVVSVAGVSGQGATAYLTFTDPIQRTDPAEKEKEDLYRQSAFATHTVRLDRVYVLDRQQWMWRWDEGLKKNRFMDYWMAVHPTSAVLASGGTLTFVPGLILNAKASSPEASQLSRTQGLATRRLSVGGTVEDAVFLPSTGEIAYIRRGDPSIRAVGVGTGASRVLGPAPAGATQIDADPTGTLIYAGGRNEVVQLSPARDPANPDAPMVVQRLKVASPVRALAFDGTGGFGAGRVAVLTGDARLQQLGAGSLQPVAATRALPKAVLAGSGRVSAAVDANGRLVVRRGSSERLATAPLRGGPVKRRKVGRLDGNGGLAMSERNTMLSVVGGKLVELRSDGTASPRSALHGRKASGRVLSVNRGGTDLAPSEAKVIVDQPVIEPEPPVPVPVPEP